MRQRLRSVAQPVLWMGGVALVSVVMIGLLSSAGSGALQSPDETQEAAEDNTPGPTPEPTSTLVIEDLVTCTAQIIEEVPVYPRLGGAGGQLGMLGMGEAVPARAIYVMGDQDPWLQIDFEGQVGFISLRAAQLEGDCGTLTREVIPSTSSGPYDPTPNPTEWALTQVALGTPTVTWEPCMVSLSLQGADQNVYAGPGKSYPVLGALEMDQPVMGTGMFYAYEYGSWTRVDFNGTEGWIESTGYEFGGNSCGSLPFIPWDTDGLPTITPSPIAPPVEGPCITRTDYGLQADRNVYSRPTTGSERLGMLGMDERVPAWGIFYGDGYGSWIQIGYNGAVGWLNGMYYHLEGSDCYALPFIDPGVPLPTITPTPSDPSAYPSPTPLPPGLNPTFVNYRTTIPGDVGASTQIARPLPRTDGGMTDNVLIEVTGIPDGVTRRLVMDLTCTGSALNTLQWGYYGSNALMWQCGDTVEAYVWDDGNGLYLVFGVHPDGIDSVTYTLTITVVE